MRFRVTRYATCPCPGMVLLSILLIVTAAHSQTERTPFARVPANQRASLKKRLNAYTEAFRKKDWAVLYDLVSDTNKVSLQDPKVRVGKDTFVRDMQDTADWQRLLKFTPVRTEIPDWLNLIQLRTETPDQVKSTPVREEIPDWLFDIYGCVEIPDGNQTLKRIGAVRAVWEHDNWYFTNWESAGPFEPCSHLSNPAWKPQLPLSLDNPMSQLTCDLYRCEL